MLYVYNMRDMVKKLSVLTEGFYIRHRMKTKPLTPAEAMLVCHALLEDAVTARLFWCENAKSLFEKRCKEYFPWFKTPEEIASMEEENAYLSDNFLTSVIDKLDMDVARIVNELIPARSWKVWSLKTDRLGNVFFMEGDDWRAQEYERLMSEKVIEKAMKYDQLLASGNIVENDS